LPTSVRARDDKEEPVRVFESLDDFRAAVGQELGAGEWHTVDQAQIDAFADATLDHQWVHVDPIRAASGPFGTTIAHGYLTLSLIPFLAESVYRVDGPAMGVNYGLEKVRFPSAVPVGSRIRVRATLANCDKVPLGARCTVHFVVEVDGGERPACTAEAVFILASTTP
jgi:acyl dehydratase